MPRFLAEDPTPEPEHAPGPHWGDEFRVAQEPDGAPTSHDGGAESPADPAPSDRAADSPPRETEPDGAVSAGVDSAARDDGQGDVGTDAHELRDGYGTPPPPADGNGFEPPVAAPEEGPGTRTGAVSAHETVIETPAAGEEPGPADSPPAASADEAVPADAAAAVEAPARPAETHGDDESGHTVPFAAVPPASEDPEEPRRRLRIPRLRRPTLRRPHLGRPTRAGLLRALPIVLLVVGGLLLLEGAVTVIWKEPFSAIMAGQTQSMLGGELKALERENAAKARSQAESTRYIRRQAVKLNRRTGVGKPLGRLRIKKIGVNMVVVQGTDESSLTKGPAHYTQTPLPGTKGNWTVGVAGHRTTYLAPFRHINSLEKGDQVVFTLPYGRFTYTVESHKIVDAANTSVFVPKGYNRIALTACHPLYSAAQRYIVYGKLTKTEPRGNARRVAAGAPR